MSYPRLAARLYNTPLLILPEKAEVIERVFRSHLDGTAPPAAVMPEEGPDLQLAAIGAQRTKAGYYRTADGVGIIQVLGSLVQRGSSMDSMSGLQLYSGLNEQLDAAMADSQVRAILLEIDSPGGEGAGLFDFAGQIRRADAIKPVGAYANEQAFSAAYALAASAGDLMVASTGMVGSVGVVMLHVDQSAYDQKRGIVYTPIFAGGKKVDFNSHAPLSDSAARDAQAMVDRLYGTFVDHVASMRGIDRQAVIDTEAGLLHPDQAQALGMADGSGSLSDAVTKLRERMRAANASSFYFSQSAAGANKETEIMEPNSKPVLVATAEQVEAARLAGAQQAQADAAKQASEASALAAKAERERVAGILQHKEAAGRGKQASHLALHTSLTVEEAGAMLAASAKETEAPTNPLAAAMERLGNPNVGADANATGDAPPPAAIDSAAIYQMRRKVPAKR